jgi:hypothetical protein
MEPRREPGSLPRCGHTGWGVWLIGGAAILALGACATSRAVGPAPRVFNLATAPAKTVPTGCPVTLSFEAESQADLVQATVTWKVTRITPRGPVIMETWYAVLPIAEHVAQPRTLGVVALQLRPRLEGRYDYSVKVEDTSGLTSNVLHKTVTVELRAANTTCPPADPVLPQRPQALVRGP